MAKKTNTSNNLKPHKPHDLVFRNSLSDITFARDFIQLYMAENTKQHIDLSTLKLESSITIDKHLKESISDIVYSCFYKDKSLGSAKIIVLIEHQSTPDKFMPIRVYYYLFGLLLQELAQRNEDRQALLPACHAIVFYHGQQTPYPYNLTLEGCIYDPKNIMSNFWQKPINLIDVNEYDDEQLLKHQLAGILSTALKYSHKKDITKVIYKILDLLITLDIRDPIRLELIATILNYMLDTSELEDKSYFIRYLEKLPTPLKGELMTIADEFRKEGEEIGEIKALKRTAINALKQGIKPKAVSKFTGLSFDEVNQLLIESKLH